MNYVYIGKIVNTHALKGEVRILSNFDFKEKVFKVGTSVYIGEEKIKEAIISYRKHKNFDMVKFKGIDNINDVLKYKGKKVYVLKSNLNLSEEEILDEDLIGMKAIFNNKIIGTIEEIDNYNGNKVIYLDNELIIPYHKNFIKNIDLNKKEITFINLEGLINED